MTNLRGTSPDLWSESGSARSSHSGLMDTTSIRQAVFDEWKSKKSLRLKEQLASKSAEKKKLEEKEKEEHERKKLVSFSQLFTCSCTVTVLRVHYICCFSLQHPLNLRLLVVSMNFMFINKGIENW